jgi:hypothetical protein
MVDQGQAKFDQIDLKFRPGFPAKQFSKRTPRQEFLPYSSIHKSQAAFCQAVDAVS